MSDDKLTPETPPVGDVPATDAEIAIPVAAVNVRVPTGSFYAVFLWNGNQWIWAGNRKTKRDALIRCSELSGEQLIVVQVPEMGVLCLPR